MAFHCLRPLEAELPAIGQGVQARGDHIELIRPVEPASRIVPLGPCLLDFDLGSAVGIGVGRHRLALDQHPSPVCEHHGEVRFAIAVDESRGRHLSVLGERPREVVLGHAAADGDPTPLPAPVASGRRSARRTSRSDGKKRSAFFSIVSVAS